MYVFNGKLDFQSYAENECATFVFPAAFALMDTVCAFWQWTVDVNGVEKANTCQLGRISTVTKKPTQYEVTISFGYYFFDAVVESDYSTLRGTLRDSHSGATGPSCEFKLQLVLNPDGLPPIEVYTGKFDVPIYYAQSEMITLVIPAGIVEGAPVGLYFQWTLGGLGIPKTNHPVNGPFRLTSFDQGEREGTFDDGFYTYHLTVPRDRKDATIHMSGSESGVAYLQHCDCCRKRNKALIVRYGTGTDNGIFLVKDMLTDHLGFSVDDIEMLYFDQEGGASMKTTQGQEAPTAARFKTKFQNLISDARAGDVRFLYVDVHSTTHRDPDGSGEEDGNDEGWIMAEGDDGMTKAEVTDDWLGSTIRSNLAAGVNLTILTSSCMGGGMLDKHTNTPGVLVAGCHETQFNVKVKIGNNAMPVDPWMNAIVSVINEQFKRKQGVPSYSLLFDRAKALIKQQLLDGEILKGNYLGPSTNELKPERFDPKTFSSHQDPQLLFISGYIDPDVEQFLFPFASPETSTGTLSGVLVRYPKDEL